MNSMFQILNIVSYVSKLKVIELALISMGQIYTTSNL